MENITCQCHYSSLSLPLTWSLSSINPKWCVYISTTETIYKLINSVIYNLSHKVGVFCCRYISEYLYSLRLGRNRRLERPQIENICVVYMYICIIPLKTPVYKWNTKVNNHKNYIRKNQSINIDRSHKGQLKKLELNLQTIVGYNKHVIQILCRIKISKDEW